MRIFAVGDIQGCYDCLRRLLDHAGFRPDRDLLWCVGDLINRGNNSLATLRFLRDLGKQCIAVLGNHDLHLLHAIASDAPPPPTLQQVIDAADCGALIDWLRHRPLIHRDKKLRWAMVHAGLPPQWTLHQARKRAKAIAKLLRSDRWQQELPPLLERGDTIGEPSDESLAFALAVFTRCRFCTADGRFNWHNSRAESDTPSERPWFAHPEARWRSDLPDGDPRNCRIVFGHWAARGLVADQPHVLGLDSGCVWGNRLTLARIDQPEIALFSIPCGVTS